MPALSADRQIEALLAEILAESRQKGNAKQTAWAKPADDIRKLVRRDYVRSLRSHLPYRELKALTGAFERLLPGFNRETVGVNLMSVESLAEKARALRLHFKASPYEGDEGLSLRGFYVTRRRGMLKRPLIYVNTAHHPLAVVATFCHEVGHHVSAGLFGLESDPVHFFFDADYNGHLDDPGELAADVVVSIAAYPEPIARTFFATPWNWGLVARAKNLPEAALNDVRQRLKSVYGFDLMERIPANQQLHYLLGMIHYAKLRWALLAEYDM
jgi:hypothetical protein